MWYFPDPRPAGWFVIGPGQGLYSYVIGAQKCPPPTACPDCGASAGKPIQLATGDTVVEETDVSLPGLGGGLSLRRKWHSLWPAVDVPSSVGIFGTNWRSTYEEMVFMGSDNYLKYSRGDGSYWSFGINNFGAFVVVSPGNVFATFTQTPSYYLITFQNGEQRRFNLTTGVLTAIIDRNGNTTQIAYDSYSRLSTITSPASQHLYFNYPNNTSLLVSSVTTDFGVTLSYSYDTQNRLSIVTQPDLTTISFTYNSQSEITQVTDINGKVLESHTYDSSGRGLTSSQANGVNSLSVTYPPPATSGEALYAQ
jgi:YD repeat-containing protein